jgi:hypothetical protein
MSLLKRRGLILPAFLLLMSCGNDQNVDTCIQEGSPTGSISVNVSCGDPISRPIYIWSDGNTDPTATRVTVEPVSPSDAPPIWDVLDGFFQDNIHSYVKHGAAPIGSAQQVVAPELDLQMDVWYRVAIYKAPLGTGPTGSREFLIKP